MTSLFLPHAESQRLRSMSRASIATKGVERMFQGSGFHYQTEGLDDKLTIADVLVKKRIGMKNTCTIDAETLGKLSSQHLQVGIGVMYRGDV